MKKIILLLILLSVSHDRIHAQYTKILDFSGATNGSFPQFDQNLVTDGTFLYGLTGTGGTNDLGTAFKIMPDGTGYVKLLDFSSIANGHHPSGSFTFDGTYLYSSTAGGGTNNDGVVFKMLSDGTGFQKLFDFNYTNGYQPTGHLYYDGTYLYGMTQQGGTSDYGTIFKIQANGTGFTTLLNFTGANGVYPFGGLVSDGTYLYGMARQGGANGIGVIFKIMPDGTGYTKLLDFSATLNGSSPYGTLSYDGTYLYGMTAIGGDNNMGVIFKLMTDGTGFTKLFDFSGTADGKGPEGTLLIDGMYLYGMTYQGGVNDRGVIFRINNDGTGFVQLFSFVIGTATGYYPLSSLLSDGTFFYGMLHSGGANNFGAIFKMAIQVGIGEIDLNQELFISPNPFENSVMLKGTSGAGEITLCDVTGKEILQQTSLDDETEINTESVSAGYYFVRYRNKSESGVFRMVKF